MSTMKIRGKLDEYKVHWIRVGGTYAVPVVQKYKKWVFFGFWYTVRQGENKSALAAEKLLPDEMLSWYTDSVNKYERYEKEWSKFKEGNK